MLIQFRPEHCQSNLYVSLLLQVKTVRVVKLLRSCLSLYMLQQIALILKKHTQPY